MTTAQMQTEANFTSATPVNGEINPDRNFTSVWYMTNGVTYPLLQALKPPAVTVNDASTTYEESNYRGGRSSTPRHITEQIHTGGMTTRNERSS